MRILDLSAGHRSIWFNRFHPDTVFVDIRESVSPTVVADTTELPFPDQSFDLIVFDPPHVTHGADSVMAGYYGAFPAEVIRDMVARTSIEAYRVSTPSAVMVFKWNDHDVRLERMLKIMESWEPLFGHKVATRDKHRSSSYWVVLQKRSTGFQNEQLLQRVFRLTREELFV